LTVRAAIAARIGIAEDYLRLVRRFPLRSVRDARHLRQAYRVLDELMAIEEADLSSGQADYLQALCDLVWAYEQRNEPDALKLGDGCDGIDVLSHMLDERGMTASDLGRLLGNRQLGAAILRRQRGLSKTNIARLCDFFGISADLFLRTSRPREQSRAYAA
jgi:antitoxin component HigA of HigAB toxin-antitoxin module